MGKFYVRAITVILNLYIGYQIICAFQGVRCNRMDIWLSCPIWAAILLIILGNEHKQYHCLYMRILQCNLLIFSLASYIDSELGIFSNALPRLLVLGTLWTFLSLLSFIFALRHFAKWSIRQKKNIR